MTATALSFANDIKPLFRESDRAAMLSALDLWSRHAGVITSIR